MLRRLSALVRLHAALALVVVALLACTADPTPTPVPTAAPVPTSTPAPTATPAPTPTATASPGELALLGVRGIVDPTNLGWPREVEGLNGVVSIPAKPLRIITASIGHDEMTLALVPGDRLVGVGAVSKDATYSNVAGLLDGKAEISREPETIIALEPDVVVTSPWFSEDGVDALTRVGIPVVQTELRQDAESRVNDILLMGYIFGEEERAAEFAAEVQLRLDSVVEATASEAARPRVLAATRYADELWVAGDGSTEGGVISSAGGVNAAAEIAGNQTTSLEGVIAMAPDVIIIPQPVAFGAEEFREYLMSSEALAEVSAVRSGQVYVVESRLYTTLSFWNIRGVEHLAAILWPDLFPDTEAVPFSLPE